MVAMRCPRLCLAIAPLALSACGHSDSPAHATAEPVTSLGEISGRWEIVRFADFEPSWRNGDGWRTAYLSVQGNALGYEIGCNHSGIRASIDRTGNLHDESDGLSTATLVGCQAERERRDREFFRFFRTNPKVTRDPGGTITFANGGTRLVVERPERRRLRLAPALHEIAGRWVPVIFETFSDDGSSGGSFEGEPGIVTIGAAALAWSPCLAATVRTRYAATKRFERVAGPQGDCKKGEQPGSNGAVRLMRIMQSNPAVLRESPDGIVLFTDGEAIHLQSEHSVLHPPPAPQPAGPVPQSPPTPPPPPPPQLSRKPVR